VSGRSAGLAGRSSRRGVHP